jgi:hypothetical protein
MNALACYLCPHCECNHWRSRTVVQKHVARVRMTRISLCAVRIIWAALAAVLSREIHDRPRKFVQLPVILCIHLSVCDFEQRGQQTVVALRQRAREPLEHAHNLVVEISSAKKRQALNEVLVGLAVSII